MRWRSEPDDGSPTLTIDFGQPREWSALLLQWDDDLRPRSYDVEVRSSDGTWETVATRDAPGAGIVERIWMPDTVSSTIRIRASNDADTGIELESYSVVDVDAAQDQDGLVRTIASRTRGAWFPEYYHGRQAFWTVVGTPESEYEALLNEYGAIEPQAGGWRIEPFILSDGIMLTRRNAQLSQHLLDGDLPIPSVVREHDGLRLEITALAVDASGPALLARYRVTNTGDTSRDATLFLCARPFQVLPPWQRLNVIGGVAKTHSVQCSARQMIINDRADVTAWMPADSWGASSFADGEIVERLAMGHTPGAAAQDPTGLASGALGYQLELAPGASQDVVVELAMSREPRQAYSGGDAARFEQILQQERSRWRSLLDRFDIVVPPEARWLIDTMKSNVAYVLINMDGPAIQPGSRTYERSWIRDGSLTGTALLATGHAERMQAFLDWFGPHQFPSGKIPCVVDARGPDPFDEHDSTGQYIYAVSQLYRFSGDRSVLENHWERVLAGVAYLQELREQRLTPEYDTPELIAYRGLVPESASHEGYMSDPMHSYWDGFFVVRGLHDAAFMARELGETQEATRIEKLAHDALTSLDESLTAAMAMHDIGYLPGCVELGDFDATSTAIGLFPCDVIPFIQTEATYFTFDRYWRRFKQRAVDAIEWRDYTPYEVRIIGAFVRLGQPERARALAEWFRLDQHPKGWNHWAEVAYQDDRLPAFIGDMPHTWVGSDFINAARSLFVYERETDETLVLGAGLDLEWITSEQGVSVNIPTAYGRLSYRCEGTARRIDFIISGDVPAPPGGLRLRPPRPDHVERVVIDGTPHRPPANGEIELRGGHAARVTVEYVQR
ncbi:MAG: discoidin domain-containing protein [Planctomycetota bacterium]